MKTSSDHVEQAEDLQSLVDTLEEWANGRGGSDTAKVVRDLAVVLQKEGLLAIQPPPDEVSPADAAKMLGVSRPHIYKLLDAGAMPFRQVGSHRKIRTADVQAYRISVEDARKELAESFARSSTARKNLRSVE